MEPFRILTDGGDDGSGEEEGAALVPVAGIVGRVFEGTHARAHGIDGVLQKREEGVKVRKKQQQHQPRRPRIITTLINGGIQGHSRAPARLTGNTANARALPARLRE